MPATPFAIAQVSVNGAAAASGGIDVPSAATLQFSGVSTVGWKQQRWELYEYPEGFATPSGWALAADGTIFSTDVLPTLVTLPASSVLWGPWSLRLKVNEAVSDDTTKVPNLTDVGTICNMLSPKGQRMIAALEGTQFCTPTTRGKSWVRTLQRNQIIVEAQLGAGGGGASLPKRRTRRTATGASNITVADDLVEVTAAAAPQTLPNTPSDGHEYEVCNNTFGNNDVNGGGHNFNITGTGVVTLVPKQSMVFTYSAGSAMWLAS